ncbi:MAG: ASKHA domain-containing protein, partial [Niameybacter sp.]
MYQLKVVHLPNQVTKVIEVLKRQCLHHLLVNELGYHAPCGGNKACRKCKVKLIEDVPYTEMEQEVLTQEEMAEHIHLACLTYIEQDLTVILESNQTYQIAQDVYEVERTINPMVKRKIIEIKNLKKIQSSDWCAAIKEEIPVNDISLKALRKLARLLEDESISITIVHDDEKILDLIGFEQLGYGVAIDIGTTTVVAYLYNLMTGVHTDHVVGINQQQNFGFDVISRIKYAHTKQGLEALSNTIKNQLNSMLKKLLARNQLAQEQIDEIVIVGNTVMMYLLLGITPKSLGVAPFQCVFTQTMIQSATEVGLCGGEHCQVILVPHMAAYVGADIISGVIATAMDQSEDCQLLLDIGTNGEMVLVKGNKMYCCATAAGPAFEGAKIECGVGGVYGAINKVDEKNDQLTYETIGDQAPIGLCGSGIIDVIAYLLKIEMIDETGYLELEKKDEFTIAHKEDGASIYITQKDVREIQLAKAAIRAGIETLFAESDVKVSE